MATKKKTKTTASAEKLPKGIEELTFNKWRHAYRLFTKHAEVVVVPSVGRILSYKLTDGQNVFAFNEKNAGLVPPAKHKGILQFGGLYTWLAPQARWVDLESGELTPGNPGYEIDFGPYEITSTEPAELTMTSPVSKTYGLKVEKNIKLDKDTAKMIFSVTLHNTGVQPVRWAVWNLTAVKPTGVVFFDVPHGESDLNFFGDPQGHARAYSEITDIIDDKYAAVDFRRYKRSGAKLFVRVGSKYLAYRQPGSWLVRTFDANTSDLFTDQQSQIELWADAKGGVFELESASPDSVIFPGKSFTWTESMSIVPDHDKMAQDPFQMVSSLRKVLGQVQS